MSGTPTHATSAVLCGRLHGDQTVSLFISAIKFLAQVHTIQLKNKRHFSGASYPPSQPRTLMSPGLPILCCAMVELDMEPGPEGLNGTVVRFMDDVFSIYAVGNSAEEQLVMEYYGKIAVGYPPPLVLNVEQPASLHRFVELQLNTGGGVLQCQLFNPVYSAVKTRGRVLQRLPEHGGGTIKRDRQSWIAGALFRMAYGCLTLTVRSFGV